MDLATLPAKLAELLDRALNPLTVETLEQTENRHILQRRQRDGIVYDLLLDAPYETLHLKDVESFVMVATEWPERGQILVDRNLVSLHPVDPPTPCHETVNLSLTPTRAWKAIQQLDNRSRNGQYEPPRDLWKLMITDLADAGTEELQLMLQEVTLAAKSAGKDKQDNIGIVQQSSRSTTMDISWGAGKKQLPTAQVFNVKVWEEADVSVDIKSRLEANSDNGLGIAIHMQNFEAAQAAAIRDLIDNVLGKQIKNHIIMHGSIHISALRQSI